ncbi:MAG: rhamnan synthesis F family protein [Pseudomonadota bacterium]
MDQLLPFSSHLLLITNNDRQLDDESQAWLAERSIELLYIRNEGYDFGMWQKALNHLTDLDQYEQLCLCNDSCICFASLANFFKWIDTTKPQAGGIVKSYEKTEHLQSYLMVLSGRAMSICINHIANMGINSTYDYNRIVSDGELGLSTALKNAGIFLHALYEPTLADNENPSYNYCAALIDQGMPMIKRKILGYPPGFLIKNSIKNNIGTRGNYYVRKIKLIHCRDTDIIEKLFSNPQKIKITQELRFIRRFTKYWIRIKIFKNY